MPRAGGEVPAGIVLWSMWDGFAYLSPRPCLRFRRPAVPSATIISSAGRSFMVPSRIFVVVVAIVVVLVDVVVVVVVVAVVVVVVFAT